MNKIKRIVLLLLLLRHIALHDTSHNLLIKQSLMDQASELNHRVYRFKSFVNILLHSCTEWGSLLLLSFLFTSFKKIIVKGSMCRS